MSPTSTIASSGSSSEPAVSNPESRYRWLLLFGVWLLYAAFGLAATSLAPLVGYIKEDMTLSHSQMGTILGIWQLVYIGSAIPCGILLDKLGSRWGLTIGGIIIALSLLTRGLSDNYVQLLAAVMIFGIGGPIISAGAPKVVTARFTGSDRGLAMGIYMTGPGIGGIISLTLTHSTLLPALEDSWRNIMFLWAGLSLVASLLWLLISSHPSAEQAASEIPSGAGSGGQLAAFKTILREPAVILVLLMSVGVFLFNHGLNNWLPELLRNDGMSFIEAGYWAAIPTVIGIIGSLLIPRLATPGRRFNILIGLSACAAAASLLLHFQEGPLLFSGLLLQGIARSSLMTVLILTLVELPAIGERYAGLASGFFFSAAEVGGVLGPVTLGLLYDATGNFDTGLYFLTAVAVATGLGGVKLKQLARQR
ncbi:MAG: MFS transporter [Pseudomonadales bacterium]|nr:MFS transporter [Pseudomonadales bacterium]MDG1441667.1 MFS transporter [Pseudomonadales bacterium]